MFWGEHVLVLQPSRFPVMFPRRETNASELRRVWIDGTWAATLLGTAAVKAAQKQEMSERVQDDQGEREKHVHMTHVVISAEQSAVLCSQLEVFPSFLNLFRKIRS